MRFSPVSLGFHLAYGLVVFCMVILLTPYGVLYELKHIWSDKFKDSNFFFYLVHCFLVLIIHSKAAKGRVKLMIKINLQSDVLLFNIAFKI